MAQIYKKILIASLFCFFSYNVIVKNIIIGVFFLFFIVTFATLCRIVLYVFHYNASENSIECKTLRNLLFLRNL